MCFEVKPKSRAKIAKTDIECWKVLDEDNAPPYFPSFSYVKGFINPTVKIVVDRYRGIGDIEEGYHSLKNENVIDNLKKWSRLRNYFKADPSRLKKFIIPAGTRYYENDTEYVSETIMLVE